MRVLQGLQSGETVTDSSRMLLNAYREILSSALSDEKLDRAMLAHLLSLPQLSALIEQAEVADVESIYQARESLLTYLASELAVQFAELFEAAQEGAVFVFTETTHRLWPEIIDVATTQAKTENGREAAAGGFDVAFPRIQRGRGKAGFQLALRKASGATLGEDVRATCERFRRDNAMHELKISGGYQRQKRKIRGAK